MLAPLYVGQTAHTPEHRFAQHKVGGKLAAKKVHKFGIKLRLDLMKGIGPFSRLHGAVHQAYPPRDGTIHQWRLLVPIPPTLLCRLSPATPYKTRPSM